MQPAASQSDALSFCAAEHCQQQCLLKLDPLKEMEEKSLLVRGEGGGRIKVEGWSPEGQSSCCDFIIILAGVKGLWVLMP